HVCERAQQGATALISTHETSRFAQYCTRVVALHRGRVIADQAIEDFLTSPGGGDDLWTGYRTLVASVPPSTPSPCFCKEPFVRTLVLTQYHTLSKSDWRAM